MAEVVVDDRKRLAVSDGRIVAPVLGKLADNQGLLTAILQFHGTLINFLVYVQK